MGLVHKIFNWGIRKIDTAEQDARLLGRVLGYMPLSWRQVVMMYPGKDGLLWRVPDPDVRMAASFSQAQALLVAENEQVMLLRNGRLEASMERGVLLAPGLYDISRVQLREQLEIIWLTTRELHLRWGVADVITADRISIGASGYYAVAITDPERFVQAVAGNAQVYKEEQLQSFAQAEVNAVIRDLMARRTVLEFQQIRREFIEAAQEHLRPIFERWGLEFRSLSIEHQQIPAQFRQAAASRTLVTMEKEAQIEGARSDIVLAQLEAQKAYYFAQIEAGKLRALGKTEVEIMQEMQRIGVDPLEVKRIEAIEKLEPGQGMLLDTRPQIVNQLFGQQGAASVLPTLPPTITGTVIPEQQQALPAPSTQQSGQLTNHTAADTERQRALTREEVQEMVLRLDERLIRGEISEQKHSELSQRLEKRLEEMS